MIWALAVLQAVTMLLLWMVTLMLVAWKRRAIRLTALVRRAMILDEYTGTFQEWEEWQSDASREMTWLKSR